MEYTHLVLYYLLNLLEQLDHLQNNIVSSKKSLIVNEEPEERNSFLIPSVILIVLALF